MLQLVAAGSVDEPVEQPPPLDLDSGPRATFADVGGLDDVKKAVHRAIILPFQRPGSLRALRTERRQRRAPIRASRVRQDATRARNRWRVRAALLERPHRADPRPDVRREREQPPRGVRAGASLLAVRALPRRTGRDRLCAPKARRERGPAARRSAAAGARRDRGGQRERARARRDQRAVGRRRGDEAPRAASTGSSSCRRRISPHASGSSPSSSRGGPSKAWTSSGSRRTRRSSAAPTCARSSSAPSTS